ncbi:hypothetical protein EJ110_NYTH36889 [Nymphaea thermarum]|nr:hypothetical protein EJ110_NYTH36889 [Nymphaea thermarum]
MTRQWLPLLIALSLLVGVYVDALGVNWGRTASHPLPPETVVQLLKDNDITKVKLFDADEAVMRALAGTGIQVVVSVPNNILATVAGDYNLAKKWVDDNVVGYTFKGGIEIKYVAVGNEPFNQAYNGSFLDVTFPALKNIQTALNECFSSDVKIVQFLSQNGAPFTVNIYTFLSLYLLSNYPIDLAFFDSVDSLVDHNGVHYYTGFDMKMDTLVSALKAVGFQNLPIVVGGVGWPTEGDKYASPAYAQRFYRGLLKKLAENEGTPLRPGHIAAYLFSLIDEDAKGIAAGNFERHWGIFSYDGKPKFPVDLSGIGSSCSNLNARDKASYAFNMYYQTQNQRAVSCDFQGLSMVTTNLVSHGSCKFPVQIMASAK